MFENVTASMFLRFVRGAARLARRTGPPGPAVRALSGAAAAVLGFAPGVRAAIPAPQRAALVALYTQAGGASWTNKTGWNGAAGTECAWFGVTCDASSSNVTRIELVQNNLAGTLPDLSALTELRVLDIRALDEAHRQELTGSIAFLSAMTKLQQVNVSFGKLPGPIPSLAGLSALADFSAAANLMTGSVPSLAGHSSLRTFNVGRNQLTGSIPPLAGLTNLETFIVASNHLSGSIPSLAGLSSLETFDAFANDLSGPIPALSSLTALVTFDVGLNFDIDGSIPSLAGLTNLRTFNVSFNSLTGSIPSLAGLTSLTRFDAGSNVAFGGGGGLTGAIPSLTGLTALESFDVGFNALAGSIPSLAGLTALKELTVAQNQLSGTIPPLSGLAALESVTAFHNQLTGPIPSLSGLHNLASVWVSENQLTGPLPSLEGLAKLQLFWADHNRISGPIPALGPLPALDDLSLSSNQLTGDIPSLAGLSAIEFLRFDNNRLSGPIPAPPPSPNLTYFVVSDNELTGPIPAFAGAAAGVGSVQVANNQLTGAVPPAPSGLFDGSSKLCGNALSSSGNGTTDAAWNDATGVDWKACQFALVGDALEVDPSSGTGHDGNGILEPGETAPVRPTWRNVRAASAAGVAGSASSFGGPAGATYTVADGSAAYGTIAGLATTPCASSGDCYALGVTDPATRPAGHWDPVFDETVHATGNPDSVRTWTLHVGESFTDVPRSHPFYRKIETVLHGGITVGCTASAYCPAQKVARSQMAIFLARGIAGSAAGVPASGMLGGQPYDCVAGGISRFSDVPPTDIACRSVHYIAAQNVTAGCSTGHYCPAGLVSRAEMAIFVAKAIVAPGGGAAVPETYGPDPGTGFSYSCSASSPNLHFTDVFASDAFCKHAHFLWATGVVGGCSGNQYCPTGNVGRDEMAKFLSNAFGIAIYGP